MTTKEEAQAVNYLLGGLSEVEQARLEERSFRDVEFSELLSTVENDLIDEYVRQTLSAHERERFERHFLVSQRRLEKVAFARSLLQIGAAVPAFAATQVANRPALLPWWKAPLASWRAPHPALSYSLAGAAVLLLVGGLWMTREISQLRREVANVQAEREASERQNDQLQQKATEQRRQTDELAAQKADLEQKLAQLKQQPNTADSQPAFLAFILTPGYRGSEGPKRLIIPRGIRVVRLQLNLNPGDEYQQYQVQLQTASGDHVRSWNRLNAGFANGERAVFVDLPARLLGAGQYELTLKGVVGRDRIEDLGYYYFNLPRSDE